MAARGKAAEKVSKSWHFNAPRSISFCAGRTEGYFPGHLAHEFMRNAQQGLTRGNQGGQILCGV
jgi:hypothetical protein